MKVLAVLLLVAVASGAKLANKQHDVLGLLYKSSEPISDQFKELKDISLNYIPSKYASHFEDNGAAVAKLDKEISSKSVLEKHRIFSLFDSRHKAEAVMIFEVFINSKDWDTFISSAAFYRELVNEAAFVYAFSVAVIHSKLTVGVVLPPLYEVTPHLFTNSEIIQKAYFAKMTQKPGKFQMDFTGSKKNPEQRVAYFGEDIGMNVHHVSWHMDYPFWWEDKYGYPLDRKGEIFFWMHHQLTSRFDNERLSNHLDPVDELYWNKPIVEGFAPHTAYKYGGEFPARPDNAKFQDVKGLVRIRDLMTMENRVRDAIAHGYVTSRDGKLIDIRKLTGIETIGDIIEASSYSPNAEYYGSLHNLAHIALGRVSDPKGKFRMPPGMMEHFETATRDPAFFRLHKYMDNIFREHKDSLPAYTKTEIEFPAVKVDSVSIDGHLKTFFEPFEFDISQAVDSTPKIKDVPITAIVQRLNHENFSFKIDVFNNEPSHVLATFRIHICPRYDANGVLFDTNEMRWHCVEMDKFWKNLNPGRNSVVRKSSDASTTVSDIPSFKDLLKKANDAIASGTDLTIDSTSAGCGIPNRMLLPKGTESGMEYSLIVAVTDGFKDAAVDDMDKNDHGAHCHCGIRGEKYPDKKPLGYPFDRNIKNVRSFFSLPNIKKTIVHVSHESKE